MQAILEVSELSKSFGGVRAADRLSFSIEEGMSVGLIGPNGSGKTTVFNIVTGLIRADSGKVIFRKKDISRIPSYRIASMGVARTFQNLRLFPQITVLENVLLGIPYNYGEGFWSALFQTRMMKSEEKKNVDKAMALLEKFELARKHDKLAMDLSHGQRRMLELARAIASDADLYLLDEPTAGVFPETRIKIMDIIRELNRQKRAVLIIEHNMDVIMNITEKIIVLNHGQKIAEGAAKDVGANQIVIEAYLGRRKKGAA